MKFPAQLLHRIEGQSLPVRGAWIEIPNTAIVFSLRRPSLPVRGAWIEIIRIGEEQIDRVSLPVRGAWIEISDITAPLPSREVVPRVGSVD